MGTCSSQKRAHALWLTASPLVAPRHIDSRNALHDGLKPCRGEVDGPALLGLAHIGGNAQGLDRILAQVRGLTKSSKRVADILPDRKHVLNTSFVECFARVQLWVTRDANKIHIEIKPEESLKENFQCTGIPRRQNWSTLEAGGGNDGAIAL